MSKQTDRDYYEILGVARNADVKTIKRAFLKAARAVHPDVSDAPDAEIRFKEVNEAYSVLSDEQRRANYDTYGDPDGPAGFGGGNYVDMTDIFGGFNMSDLFESFFGGSARSSAEAGRTRGRNMGITLRISLEEAACGCEKTVSYDRLAPCDDCEGSGLESGGSIHKCSRCQGKGYVVTVQRTILGQMQSQTVCPDCGGAGQTIDKPCETCGGQGRTPSRETVDIKIPAGVRAGAELCMTGYGEAGIRNDKAGDLIVSIDIYDNDRFQRNGDDLYCMERITALEAMLGCDLSISGIMPDEEVLLHVPAGTQQEAHVVAPGYGMPRVHTDVRGDLIVVITITIPDDLTDAQRKSLYTLACERGERVGDNEAKN